ncbi:hypothetical protein CBS101457_006598 [Exobasidium rhododendri]|nr:hypothetical protein CBS101457_006598 [Exobasidium rhododendri]
MSTIDDRDAPGPSKRKRVRSRKGRKRTNEVEKKEEQAGSSSSSSSDSEEEERKNRPTVSKAVAAKADIEESAPVDIAQLPEETGEEKKDKRKRKRTRGKAKKVGEEELAEPEADGKSADAARHVSVDNTEHAAADIIKTAPIKPSVEMLEYLEKVGLPNNLNEKTSNALRYARQYHVDRANWKFNKAKQEYLIRHMLTPPVERKDGATEGQRDGEGDGDGKGEDGGDDEGKPAIDQFWPDDWNRCVAKYLITIQGKAKERLFDILNLAAQRDVPPVAQEQSMTPGDSSTAALPPHSAPTVEAKSVSFGDLAMEQQNANAVLNSGIQSNALSAVEVSRIQFEKERAQKMLMEFRS